MAEIIKHTYKLKRGTAQRFIEINPILDQGEPGFEYDTYKLKIGDGFTPWNSLPYIGEVSPCGRIVQDLGDNPDFVMSQKAVTEALNFKNIQQDEDMELILDCGRQVPFPFHQNRLSGLLHRQVPPYLSFPLCAAQEQILLPSPVHIPSS